MTDSTSIRLRLFRIFFFLLAIIFTLTASAEDRRERQWFTPALPPRHAAKPRVNGWAVQRVEEKLGRGLIAQPTRDGKVYLSWRLLKSDPSAAAFNVYRAAGDGAPVKLNAAPLTATTDFIDVRPPAGRPCVYTVRPVLDGRERDATPPVRIEDAAAFTTQCLTIEFQGDYTAQRIATADLDGDGVYDFLIKQPGSSIDPAGDPNTDGTTYKLEAYLSSGAFLWRQDLGPGIEPGIWYSPWIAYDLDGDGKAEVAAKTGPADARGADGRVTRGPEWVSVFDGLTGKETARADWPPREERYGDYNRQNRNQIGVAFLDGKTPCLIVARGTYKLMVVDAYQYHAKKLERLWHWEGDEETPVIRSQGSHQMHAADVDGDGREEVVLGSCVLDDNGTCLWSCGLGHPDKTYVTDVDPTRPGLEFFYCSEPDHAEGTGIGLLDAATGKTIWTLGKKTFHVGDAMTADLDPALPGLECWASEDPKGGSRDKYLFSAAGKLLATGEDVPACRNWLWWDADLLRETITGGGFAGFGRDPGMNRTDQRTTATAGASRGRSRRGGFGGFTRTPSAIAKYKGETVATGIEGSVAMIADLLGDWREEVVTVAPGVLRVYTTTIPAADRRPGLMQDPIYRADVALRPNGYEQSPVTGFYLGADPAAASKSEPVISKPVKPTASREGFQQ